MKDNYGLLIASLVAIVAIVGLVILFSGATTGAVSKVYNPDQVMRPCSGELVGSACMTRFSQVGNCENLGRIYAGDEVCGVDVGCTCQFQR